MKIVKPLPPQELHIKVSAETLEGLKLYQRYQKESCSTSWDLKEMTAAILGAFLIEGDADFQQWRKQSRINKRAALETNGATDA